MTISLTPEFREVLMEHLLARVAGISDLALVFDKGEIDEARRIGVKGQKDLALLLDGLGLDSHVRAAELTMPADDLERLFSEFHREGVEKLETEKGEREAFTSEWAKSDLLVSGCEAILDQIRRPDRSGGSS